MALPEAGKPGSQPQGASGGGMLVTTPMGPQSQQSSQKGPNLSPITEDEQKAGKEAVKKAEERKKQEQETGQKIMQRLSGGKS